MKRLELTVHGAVQGVGFRAEAARQANALGLTGAVRNDPDGGVSMVAEGPERRLRAFLDWAKAGPPAARVNRHDITWAKPTGDFRDFAIVH